LACWPVDRAARRAVNFTAPTGLTVDLNDIQLRGRHRRRGAASGTIVLATTA